MSVSFTCELKLANGIDESVSWSASERYPYGGARGIEECILTIRSGFFEEVHEVERVSVRRDHRRLVSLC